MSVLMDICINIRVERRGIIFTRIPPEAVTNKRIPPPSSNTNVTHVTAVFSTSGIYCTAI
jgi:hypothetical protein